MKHQTPFREWLGRGFTFLANALVSLRVTDVTCGFKCFKRSVIRPIFGRLAIYDWSFDAEVIFLARRLGFTLREVPVRWMNADVTHVRLGRDVILSLLGLLKIRWNQVMGRYPVHAKEPRI